MTACWEAYVLDDLFWEDPEDFDLSGIEQSQVVTVAIVGCIAETCLPPLPQDPDAALIAVRELLSDLWTCRLPRQVPDATIDRAFLDVLAEAEDLLRAGLAAEAEHRLRRVIAPKFATLPHCVAAYGAAMGEVWGPPEPPPHLSFPLFQDLTP